MVSRRNFITIALMMLILLFMFQFSCIAKEALNEYGINQYEEESATGLSGKNIFVPLPVSEDAVTEKQKDYVIYIGDTGEGALQKTVYWWCSYSKRKLQSYEALKNVSITEELLPEVIIIDSSHLDLDRDLEILRGYTSRGISLVFANLPAPEEIDKNQELRKLLGIRFMATDEVTLKGIHLFGGFLLGGESIYEAETKEEQKRQDLNLNIPWYVTDEGTKTYMMGTIEGEDTENEYLPAIIWRNSVENAKVFAVNGDYLSDVTGIGILNAMMAEMNSCEIYPVVNAQNLAVADYPGLAQENQEEIMRRYSQDQRALFREVMWPALVSVTKKTNDRMTCLIAPQYDYLDGNEPDGNELLYYLKILNEEYGEAGLSGGMVSEITIGEKLMEDYAFLQEHAPDYAMLSFYLPKESQIDEVLDSWYLPDLRTLAVGETDYEGAVVSYVSADVTVQRATSSGIEHTFTDDLRVKSIETALGYSNIVLDLLIAAYPDSKEDSWENLSKEISSNLCTYWKAYEGFEKTTLSESDQRIRRFLALDYYDAREGNTITVDISGFEEEAWFLLRLNGEKIKEIDGGTCQEIENGAWLIHAVSDSIQIELEEEMNVYYY